jgi:hypothetical protein
LWGAPWLAPHPQVLDCRADCGSVKSRDSLSVADPACLAQLNIEEVWRLSSLELEGVSFEVESS